MSNLINFFRDKDTLASTIKAQSKKIWELEQSAERTNKKIAFWRKKYLELKLKEENRMKLAELSEQIKEQPCNIVTNLTVNVFFTFFGFGCTNMCETLKELDEDIKSFDRMKIRKKRLVRSINRNTHYLQMDPDNEI
jgi:hypothetical protein